MITLTPRQQDVVRALMRDARCRVVATTLGLSIHTVRMHVRMIAAQLPGEDTALCRVLRHGRALLTPDQEQAA